MLLTVLLTIGIILIYTGLIAVHLATPLIVNTNAFYFYFNIPTVKQCNTAKQIVLSSKSDRFFPKKVIKSLDEVRDAKKEHKTFQTLFVTR